MRTNTLRKKMFSVFIIFTLVLGSMVVFMSWTLPTVKATVVLSHNAGNLDFNVDNHGTMTPYMTFNGVQINDWGAGPNEYTFFFFDQADYDRSGNDKDLATGRAILGEFDTTVSDDTLQLLQDDGLSGNVDKSYGSYTHVATQGSSPVNDIRVFSTGWSVQGEDWAIIQWTVEDLTGVGMTEVRFGLRYYSRLEADPDYDDQDHWNDSDEVYYLTDSNITTTIGFASADTGFPINIFKGDEYAQLNSDELLRTAIEGTPSVYGVQGNILSVVGWTNPEYPDTGTNDGFILPAGGSITRALIIAGGNSYNDIKNAIDSARQFYLSQILMITEIADELTPRVEVYNSGGVDRNLNDFRLSVDSGTTFWTGGSWVPNPVPAGNYSIWTLAGTDAFDSIEGDTLSLWDTSSVKKYDEVAFGQEGIAPDPINDASIGSISRVPGGGGGYSTEWVHSLHGMTFGTQNNENPINHNPSVVLNEIMFNPTQQEYGFIEVMYIGNTSINIQNYWVVTDAVDVIGPYVLDKSDRYWIITQPDAPFLFTDLISTGDNVYLYDSSGVLLDMVGWDSPHQVNKTTTRVPDGNGSYQGFDDITSIAAGWVFDQAPSIPLVNIGPADQFEYGDQGDEVWFNLTITNKQSIGDLYDLINSSWPNGWLVEIFLDDLTTKITDTDGDGYPDIWINGNSTVNISIKVIVPNVFPPGDFENSTVTVRANSNEAIADSVMVQIRVYPYLIPDKTVTPSAVNVNGTGFDEMATVNLSVTGAGFPTITNIPQDVIFLIDISGSMSLADIQMAQDGATEYVNQFFVPDTAAVMYYTDGISYNPSFICEHHLTDDFVTVREDLNKTITMDMQGNTYIGSAIWGATDEFLTYGNDSHLWVIVLLSDGGNNGGMDLWLSVDEAANNGIIIYTIGLGDLVDQWELEEIARRTGGEYYYVEDASDLIDVYLLVAASVNEIAGWDIDTSDTSPMIRDVLPPWINVDPLSFTIPPDTFYFNETGYTILEWNVSKISIGELWGVEFQITTSKVGTWPSNDFTTSRIEYNIWNQDVEVRLFPEAYIRGIIGEPQPPELFIDVVDNFGNPDGKGENIRLSWIPPTTPNTAYYLLYKSNSQTGFDFSSPWINTNTDSDNWSGIDPKRTTWNDTGVVMSAGDENYYCIRAVNTGGEVSDTSRTVGFWTTSFEAKTSTFSLPLKPIQPLWTDDLLIDMAANYIKWMDPTTHVWMKHGDGEVNNSLMEIGKGFTINFTSQTKYSFSGIPGAMIQYDNVSFGFDATPGIGNADDLTADVDVSGTVTLNWTQPLSMNPGEHQFYVLRSQTRDGFWGGFGAYDYIATIPVTNPGGLASFQDTNIAQDGTEYYYMIMPVNASSGLRGSSSYSIGVWTAGYLDQYDTIGLPLKLDTYNMADWYCDKISGAVGINYYDESNQRWQWHSTRMPGGAFDTLLEAGLGYQISTSTSTKYSFVGI